MESLSLSESFTLIAAGASVAIAAIAIGLSLVYLLLAKRLFRRIEGALDEHENSVNQMYGALTKLSKRSESSASEMKGRVLELQEMAKQIGKDAEHLNRTASKPSELEPILPFFQSPSQPRERSS